MSVPSLMIGSLANNHTVFLFPKNRKKNQIEHSLTKKYLKVLMINNLHSFFEYTTQPQAIKGVKQRAISNVSKALNVIPCE
jgi:hypothetical protein